MDDVMLPYRTDWLTIKNLLDFSRGKGVDRSALESKIGSGEVLRETLNAAEQLGLIDREGSGEVRLTPDGERLAYAVGDADKRSELARAILSYPPYAIPLERAVAEDISVVDGRWVVRVWQIDMDLGQPRNRVEEARTFFFRLADDAGLGTFRRGVRGQPTRLELNPETPRLIQEMTQESVEEQPPVEAVPGGPVLTPVVSTTAAGSASLAVTVDMTDWDLDKIEVFLRLVGLIPADRS